MPRAAPLIALAVGLSTPAYGLSAATEAGAYEVDLDLAQGSATYHETILLDARAPVWLSGGAAHSAQSPGNLMPGQTLAMAHHADGRVLAIRPWPGRDDTPTDPRFRKVTATVVHMANSVLSVRTAHSQLELTADHPVFVVGKGFTPAGELRAGQRIKTLEGDPATVLTVAARAARATPVYNLRVADFHTYYVGPERLLVHNGVACSAEASHGGADLQALREQKIDEIVHSLGIEHGNVEAFRHMTLPELERVAQDAAKQHGELTVERDWMAWGPRPLAERAAQAEQEAGKFAESSVRTKRAEIETLLEGKSESLRDIERIRGKATSERYADKGLLGPEGIFNGRTRALEYEEFLAQGRPALEQRITNTSVDKLWHFHPFGPPPPGLAAVRNEDKRAVAREELAIRAEVLKRDLPLTLADRYEEAVRRTFIPDFERLTGKSAISPSGDRLLTEALVKAVYEARQERASLEQMIRNTESLDGKIPLAPKGRASGDHTFEWVGKESRTVSEFQGLSNDALRTQLALWLAQPTGATRWPKFGHEFPKTLSP